MGKSESNSEIVKRLLTELETARYLGRSRAWLRACRVTGNIEGKREGPPYCRFGRSIMYDLGDLDAWITEHRVSA